MTHKHVISGPQIEKFSKLEEEFTIVDDHIGQDEAPGLNHLVQLMREQPDVQVFVEYCTSPVGGAVAIPWYWMQTIKRLSSLHSKLGQPKWGQKSQAFGFTINKLRDSRYRLLELLSKHNLTTSSYTLVSDEFKETFPPKFWLHPHHVKLEGAILNKEMDNTTIYHQYTFDQVYNPSYIQLISEPGWQTPGTFLSEKSVFPFDAGCIPIWVGGWKHADWFKSIGFDVFDDIVDHSYQSLDNPNDRLEQAIILNKNLLQNKDLLADFFERNRHRFEANRELLHNGTIREKYLNQINNLNVPQDCKDTLKSLMAE